MKCRYCNENFATQKIVNYGMLPMTPNALAENELKNADGDAYYYDYAVTSCDMCGLIQQVGNPDFDILYHKYKNQEVGPTWSQHYIKYADFIIKYSNDIGSYLEVGCGDFALAKELLTRGVSKITTVDRNTGSEKVPSPMIDHKEGFLEEIQLTEKYDTVYSSHVFEHIEDIHQHFKAVVKNINVGSKYFISLPDFEPWIKKTYLNAFNQEHVVYPLISDIKGILGNYGFEVIGKEEYVGHSLFVAANYIGTEHLKKISPLPDSVNSKRSLLMDFSQVHADLKEFLQDLIVDKNIYIFGANSSSQVLLSSVLKDVKIECILDNASLKENKYLYGFNYVVMSPQILRSIADPDNCIVIVFVGAYSEEIKCQINELNPRIKVITEKDFL